MEGAAGYGNRFRAYSVCSVLSKEMGNYLFPHKLPTFAQILYELPTRPK